MDDTLAFFTKEDLGDLISMVLLNIFCQLIDLSLIIICSPLVLQYNQMLGWFGPKVEFVGPSRDVTVRLLVKKMTSPRARSSTGSEDH